MAIVHARTMVSKLASTIGREQGENGRPWTGAIAFGKIGHDSAQGECPDHPQGYRLHYATFGNILPSMICNGMSHRDVTFLDAGLASKHAQQ